MTQDNSDGRPKGPEAEVDGNLEQRVFRLVGSYLAGRLSSKYDKSWEKTKTSPHERGEYERLREKLAKEAFLAVRSRTGTDFIEYFVATLCATPQRMSEDKYIEMTRALIAEPDRVRTLTLLALSARA